MLTLCFSDAGVPHHACVCYRIKNVTIEASNAELINRMGTAIVEKINSYLTDKPQCAVLRLGRVLDVHQATVGGRQDKQLSSSFVVRPKIHHDLSHKYTVSIATVPGDAHFYATCIVRNGEKDIEVLDQMDRLNRYNNQSYCVKEKPLKLYCYCKVQ